MFFQTAMASCSVGGDGVRLHAVIRHVTASPRVSKEKERFIGEGEVAYAATKARRRQQNAARPSLR